MPDRFTAIFEKLWVGFRARWCDSHDLGGATAFSHDDVKVPMLHRVVQIDVPETGVDTLIDSALDYFREREFECAFTLSPPDRPSDLAERLERRGFSLAMQAVAMRCDRVVQPVVPGAVRIEEPDPGRYGTWADTMCRSFDFPDDVGVLGRRVLDIPEVRLYLATVDGQPAGTALLYTEYGVGCVDFVGTLPRIPPQGRGVRVDRSSGRGLSGDGQSMDRTRSGCRQRRRKRIWQRVGFRPGSQPPALCQRHRSVDVLTEPCAYRVLATAIKCPVLILYFLLSLTRNSIIIINYCRSGP